jgi:DUF4097 and DUF4098 domain-containing protein YvlB
LVIQKITGYFCYATRQRKKRSRAMNEERMAILKMLEDGKITATEAERLLNAVEPDAGSGSSEKGGEKDFFEMISEGVSRSFKAVQEIDVEKVVNAAREAASEAVESVQRFEAGRRVSEVVDEVSGAVSDFAGTGGKIEVREERDWTLGGEGIIRIRAETTNGNIELTGVDGDQVEVHALIKVRAGDEAAARGFAQQVEVEVDQVEDEIRVRREFPKPPRGVRVEVGYQIRCPSRLHVGLFTLNGKIEIHGAAAEVEAATSNGDIELQGGKGWVHTRTKNGKIRARVDELQGEGEFASLNGKVEVAIDAGQASLEGKTLNGSIELQLPADFDGQLDAQTTNGRVSCEFPIPVAEKGKKNRLEGPLGRGGESRVRLHTLNGSIALKRGA